MLGLFCHQNVHSDSFGCSIPSFNIHLQPKNHDEPKKTKTTRSPSLNRKKTAFVRYLLLFCVDAVAGACWEHNKLSL
jgi:hypothetical protein